MNSLSRDETWAAAQQMLADGTIKGLIGEANAQNPAAMLCFGVLLGLGVPLTSAAMHVLLTFTAANNTLPTVTTKEL